MVPPGYRLFDITTRSTFDHEGVTAKAAIGQFKESWRTRHDSDGNSEDREFVLTSLGEYPELANPRQNSTVNG